MTCRSKYSTIQRLVRLTILDLSTIDIILAIFGLLVSIGLIYGVTASKNYVLLTTIFDKSYWAALLAGYSLYKIIKVLYEVPIFIRIISSLFGMWLWVYIFLSFTLHDPGPIEPLELVLITPLTMELWSLTSLFYLASAKLKKA